MDIREQFRDDKQIEVQQRSVEFVSLFDSTDDDARRKILKPMPVPKLERLFDQRTSVEKKTDTDSEDPTDTETETESDSGSDSEGSDSEESSSEKESDEESEDSLASDSDDSPKERK